MCYQLQVAEIRELVGHYKAQGNVESSENYLAQHDNVLCDSLSGNMFIGGASAVPGVQYSIRKRKRPLAKIVAGGRSWCIFLNWSYS